MALGHVMLAVEFAEVGEQVAPRAFQGGGVALVDGVKQEVDYIGFGFSIAPTRDAQAEPAQMQQQVWSHSVSTPLFSTVQVPAGSMSRS